MLAAVWDKVLQQLDNWFDWLWRLLYPWKVLQLSPSLPQRLQLCLWTALPWHVANGWQQDAASPSLSGYSDVWVTQGLTQPLMGTWETGTARDRAPRCHPGCRRLVLNWDLADVARAVPPLRPRGGPIAPRWCPFPAPLQQLQHRLPSPCSTGVSLVHGNVAGLTLQQTEREMRAREGRKGRVPGLLSLLPTCLNLFFV